MNGKADMDCILPRSEGYIRTWQMLTLARTERITSFGQLEAGDRFTFPGGMTPLTKLSFYQAQASSGQILICEGWERVVKA